MSIGVSSSFGYHAAVCLAALMCSVQNVAGAETHTLEEPPSYDRVDAVECRIGVTGQVETALGGGKHAAHELKMSGSFRYRERRLTGNGRDAKALRSLRHYQETAANITIARQSTTSRLRDSRRLIVAEGRRPGVLCYSPAGSMSPDEVELLRMPGDSLAALVLLPQQPVEVGESWKVPSWGVQMLSVTDAVLKSEVNCVLESVESDVARVTFSGSVVGATAGAATDIKLSGHYLFNLKQATLSHLELEQTEKRAVGAVTPALNVVANVVLERQTADDEGPLDDAAVAAVPLEPEREMLKLSLQTAWNARFQFDRNWHVFQQSNDVVVLRLIDKGSFIAQCNVTRIPSAAPGRHTPEEEFQNDIREALGSKLKEITESEVLESGNGRFKYRVTAAGEANKVPMNWIYYLCTDPGGAQTALVFAVESKLRERLSGRDAQIVRSLEFFEPKLIPAEARDE